jgi:hypothetical protein
VGFQNSQEAVMKMSFLPLKPIFALTATISLTALLLPQPTIAQSTRNILQDLDPQQNSDDPLSPRSDEVNNMGAFGLIHRVLQGNRNLDLQEQNQQLNDAASAFKAKQEQLYQQQQTQQPLNQPGSQVTTPRVITPQSGS